MITVDVIVPVYKPTNKLKALLKMLGKQTIKPNKIILMNTEKKYFDDFFAASDFLEKFDNLEIHHIAKEEFDHGKTRGVGVSYSTADYFICMTDDAIPYDIYLVEKLLDKVVSGEAASSYGRQCVSSESSIIERFSRKFNYPAESYLKSIKDIDKMGIKTFFCSNVCACYNRKIFDELGGFVSKTIFNEDMIYAYEVIKNGYSIYYCADAKVRHSHDYTNMQQLKRNFDLGVSQAEYAYIFSKVSSTGEGKKLVLGAIRYLLAKKRYADACKFFVNSCFKFAGYIFGKNYKLIPKAIIMKLTMNPGYWM